MIKKFPSFSAFLKNDEAQFRLSIGLKLALMNLFFLILLLFFLYVLLKIDLIFFNANQFPGAKEFQEGYYNFILSSLLDLMPFVFLGLIVVFAVGVFLTKLILRPFKILSKYCEDYVNDRGAVFNPELLSDHRLLILFSEYFFNVTDEMMKSKVYRQVQIPQKFTKIHKPTYDWTFFMSYFLIIIVLTAVTSLAILYVDGLIRMQIIELSTKYLKATPSVKYFLSEQFVVFDSVVYLLMVIHAILHIFFGFYLYSKVSTPAFAIFSSMRSFLKGNRNARVHLIGYNFLREDSRKINRYLDLLSRL